MVTVAKAVFPPLPSGCASRSIRPVRDPGRDTGARVRSGVSSRFVAKPVYHKTVGESSFPTAPVVETPVENPLAMQDAPLARQNYYPRKTFGRV